MTHTVTAVFDHRGDAQHALNKLLAAGFDRADAVLSSTPRESLASDDGKASASEATPFIASRRQLFTRFFGAGGESRPDNGADAFIGTRHVLTLTTESETQAHRAAELIAPPLANAGDGLPDGIHGLAATHGAAFHGQHREPGPLSEHPVQDGFASADEVAAKRYGHAMHASDRYRNRSWQEVGEEVTHGWALRNPGTAKHHAFGPAIHQGWDETSPDIDDDSYFRTHWHAPYARAASHGQQQSAAPGRGDRARESAQRHIRHWTAASADRKANWARNHPDELRPWERFKDAVLHGWDRISLGNEVRLDD